MNRVVVTGLGAISPAGPTATATWDAVLAGRSAIGRLELPRRDKISCTIAAQVRDFVAEAHFDPRQLTALDRATQFSIVAAREAAADAGLGAGDPARSGASVILGLGAAGLHTLDDNFYRVYAEGASRVHPLTVPRLMANAPASQVAMDLGLHGNSFTIASACASGAHAIGTAARSIRYGDATVAVAGGAEAGLTVGHIMGWEALRVLSTDGCRPFSRDRNGLVLGEGAAVLVLEARDHALARGARIYAELTGFGGNADAGDLTSPDQANVARAIGLALADARIGPADVGYINAHGTATRMNDAMEAGAIRDVFGDTPPPVSASKAVLGHGLGAAGAFEALVTVLALHDQVIPPTANCRDPDLELGIDMVPEGARRVSFAHAISNSFAFGGLNAVLAFARADDGAGVR